MSHLRYNLKRYRNHIASGGILSKGYEHLDNFNRRDDVKAALIVHLYYVDSWELIGKSLNEIKGLKFDLFITIPADNLYFIEKIRSTNPEVNVTVVNNRGRDVLPFLIVANKIKNMGYEYILKLHSKKSTHRTDGSDWFKSILHSLIPIDENTSKRLNNLLLNRDTGLIGPKDQYVSLAVNFEANGGYMTYILNGLHGSNVSYNVLQKDRSKYGFFAGTMFWVRSDAIRSILDKGYSMSNFDPEKGQIDGTFAHAMERIFSLESEINKRKIYEIDSDVIEPIKYDSGTIPDWSEVYIGPKDT